MGYKLHFILPLFLLGTAALIMSEKEVSVTRTKDGKTYAPGDLIFEDNFDTLDLNTWHHEINMNGGGNGEFQIYNNYSVNAYTRGGILYINPKLSLDVVFGGNYEELYNGYLKLEGCTDESGGANCERQANYPYINPPAVSARLRSKGSFAYKYGRAEVRARMPAGDWTWPAIWLLPEDWVYGGWPTSGEIDLVESRGNRKLFAGDVNIGSEQMGSTLHYGPFWPHNGWWAAHGTLNSPVDQGYDRDFHIYEVIWTPNNIQFFCDSQEVVNIVPPEGGFWELGQFPPELENPWIGAENFRMAPFDQYFHFVLNVAVGGAFFPDGTNPPKPWGTDTVFNDFFQSRDQWIETWNANGGENAAMAIDYIRVYAI